MVFFSLSSPLLKLLIRDGGKFGLKYPNAISFCNILFVGNMCASLLILAFFGAKGIIKDLWETEFRIKMRLLFGGVLAVIYPALIFSALELTGVTNVVLLSRFEVVMYAISSYLFLKTPISKFQGIGYGVIVLGIGLLVLINNNFSISRGEIYILVACVVHGIAVVNSKCTLGLCPLSSFVFFRNFFSAIIFFILAIYWFGFHHFKDAFHGELWVVMSLYAVLSIVIAQFLWYKGLEDASPKLIANLSFLMPFLTIMFASLLLGEKEYPTGIQYLAMTIIAAGMILSKVEPKDKTSAKEATGIDRALAGG